MNDADRRANGERGQAGLLARFEREVDPDGTLTEHERVRQAENARRAHMSRLAAKSHRSGRRTRRTTSEPADQPPAA